MKPAMQPQIQIVGAGPAGASAAIAALSDGAAVHLFERSAGPRHKVCGEFIPPEACAVLENLGVWSDVLDRRPARLRRCILRFGSRSKQWTFAEPAISLSRFELDRLLLNRAIQLGAEVTRGAAISEPTGPGPVVIAHGRYSAAPRSGRLFGFKAHFDGPVDDAVELYFTQSGYFGVSSIEDNHTNVCGLAPEDTLRRYGFDIDAYVQSHPPLADRLRPLSRRMSWLRVGPLIFSPIALPDSSVTHTYPAGDALAFVDPFTGSGILNALLTGRSAGLSAARGVPAGAYARNCRTMLDRPFAVSTLFRLLLRARLSHLAMFVPGSWLYRLTRAHPVGAFDA
jgi:menaquinone-9 beta-reductase